jgi:hypothetical protein
MPTSPLAPIFKYADGPALDAFGRLRVSVPSTLFESQQQYSENPLIWDHHTVGTGTATYNSNRASTILSTGGTATGARALRQTKIYERYIPGKSFLVKITGTLAYSGTFSGTASSSVWYGDDNNGFGFIYKSDGWYVAKRTNTTGSVVTTSIHQSNWSSDPMNGSGLSGITLDPTKSQIFAIDFQWLGVGRIRYGFQINGVFHLVHEIMHANLESGVYMQTANLPIRYEVFNEGGTGANISQEAICSSIDLEGGGYGDDEHGLNFCVSNGVGSITAPSNAYVPIISMRVADLFKGKTYRGHVHIDTFEALVNTNSVHYKVLWNATLTGPSWVAAEATHSGVEYDISSSAVSGGVEIGCGYWQSGTASNKNINNSSISAKLQLARTYANVRDTMTIVARSLTGTAGVSCAIPFIEQY